MRRTKLLAGLTMALLLALPAVVYPVPTLQLDIGGGSYDPVSETVVTTSDQFTLYAILTTGDELLLEDYYYVSVALTPPSDPGLDNAGSFTLDGLPILVTGDMDYGTAPLEFTLEGMGWDAEDLQKHGIFPTYYFEYEIQFDPEQTCVTYNTQEEPGGLELPADGEPVSYYVAIEVDSSLLGEELGLHFDLYNKDYVIDDSGLVDTDRDFFAPFSHDAEKVPEPSSALLLLLGLGSTALLPRRRNRT